MFKVFLLYLQVSVILPLSATLYHEMDNHQLVHCTVSSVHQNRIILESGKIEKVLYPEGDLSVHLEEHSGQVFVYALSPMPRSTTISIITTEGIVQDIELHFLEKSAEILVLTNPACTSNECFEGKSLNYRDEGIMENILTILDGEVPQGYFPCDFIQEQHIIKKGIVASQALILQGPHEAIYVWRVNNLSKLNKPLTEKEFDFQNSSWVFLQKNQLSPGEQIVGVTSVKL